MEYGLKHAAERKAFEAAVSAAMRKADKSGSEGYVEMVNVIQKVLGDAWSNMHTTICGKHLVRTENGPDISITC